MIRVTAPSRLHFGSFSLPATGRGRTYWPDLDGNPAIPARHFGGVGLMIDRPGTECTAHPSNALHVEGPCAERVRDYVERAAVAMGFCPTTHIRVERSAPEHVGLGTGSQLALASAYAAVAATGLWDWVDSSPARIASATGRGERSALGIYGFDGGGFLVEGGKSSDGKLAPLIYRHDFPADWLILLVIPGGLLGIHGPSERQAFASLTGAKPDLRRTEALTRLVLLGMLPALVTRDLEAFGESVYDFNRRVGEMYAPWQGGTYSHPQITEIVRLLRKLGARGVGQSSWGPTVFAIVTADQAHELSDRLVREHHVAPEELTLAQASCGVVMREE
jgi:beta-ribofuranosylaminobenzene 5'-phosphate synthase